MKHGSKSIAISTAYLHGWVTHAVEDFARGLGIPAAELAAGLGALLLSAAGRPELGSEGRLPGVRGNAALRGAAVEPVAVADRSSGRAASGKNWWWSLTGKQRAAIKRKRARTMKRNAKLAAK